MRNETIVLQGTVKSDGSLEGHGKVGLPAGPVEVTVKALGAAGGEDLLSLLARIRAEQQASGHVPRSREGIDADVRQMRDEWEEHQVAIERLQEEGRGKRAESAEQGVKPVTRRE
jgi:hypothetical protein